MSQIMFNNGGMRNIGANGNQPLITNQNDFQFFDNVTRVAGKHTMKAGGSLTLRSREILNADTIVGRFDFNQNLTSNCAGITSGCTIQSNTGFDFASFLLGYASNASRTLFDPGTYTETRPEYALYFRTTSASTNRLTVNAGLRWDVYVPWIEVDNKQSNFDVSTGRFVVASDNATINGVEVGRYLQTYSRRDFGPRLGFRLRPDRATAGPIVRGGYGLFWNFTPGGTSSSKAQNQPFLQAQATDDQPRHQHPPVERPRPGARACIRSAAGRFDAFGVPDRLPRRARAQLQRQRAAAARRQLHGGSGLLGSRTKRRGAEGGPQSGAADRRRRRSEREPALRDSVAGAAHGRRALEHAATSSTTAC